MKITFYNILFLFTVTSLLAQTDSDSIIFSTPPINVRSGRLSTLVEDSPSSVQFLDKDYITKSNGNQLAEILKSVNNVFVKSYGGNSSLKTISLNGLNAEHTLILLNGVKLNSYQNAQFDLSLLSKDNIESIEVLSSGSSASYGSDAVSGVVNIKTFSGGNDFNLNSFSTNFKAEIGSYNYKKYDLSFSGNMKNSALKLSYNREMSDDDFEYYYFNGINNELKQRNNNSYAKGNLYFDYTYLTDSKKLSFISYYHFSERNLPGLETGSEPSSAKQNDRNWNTIINYEAKGENYFYASLNYQNNLTNYSPYANEQDYYKNIVYALNLSYQFNFQKTKLIIGSDVYSASIESNNISGAKDRTSASLFAANETKVLKNLAVFPSLRFENISDINKRVVTSKLGVNYKPLYNNFLILRSTLGNSFRSPTFNELYWNTGGNVNLNPEKSLNIEAGIMSMFNFLGENSFEVNYTFINAIDKIIWKPGNTIYWSPVNVGNSVSNVLNINLNSNAKLSEYSSLCININYSRNSSVKKNMDYVGDPTYNKQLIYIPQDLFKFNADFNYKNYGLGLFSTILGRRFIDYENLVSMNPDFLLDGNIYAEIPLDKLTANLKFEINNITNENYQVISGYPMPLRNYKFIITLKY